MLTRATHFLALLLPVTVPSCHWFSGGGIPTTVMGGCPADLHGDDITPLGDTSTGALIRALIDRGFAVRWEAGRTGGGVIRATRTDPLTHQTAVLGFEVTPAPASSRYLACAHGVTLIARMEADGRELSPYEVETTLMSLIDQGRPAVSQNMAGPAQRASGNSSMSATVTAPGSDSSLPAQGTEPRQPVPPPAQPASEDAAFGPAYQQCMRGGDAAQGIGYAIQTCVGDEWARQDAELNRVYRARMASMPPVQQQALRTEERAWLKATERKCAEPSDGGTYQRYEATMCQARETLIRVQQLQSM